MARNRTTFGTFARPTCHESARQGKLALTGDDILKLRSHPWASTLAAIACAAFSCTVYGAAGDLDSQFGSAGKTTIDFGGTEDQLGGIARQADGHIVAVGSTLVETGG